MNEIYIVDPESKKLSGVQPVSFAAIGVKERGDLEEWVLNNPGVLGEELLVITSEYDRFDKSNRRLDVLALDKNGLLVVVELKLDLSRSYADQQAIRYAAFCSTMTMDDVVDAYVAYDDKSKDEAETAICGFLNAEELPELDDRPRIILAAGSLDDQELTSTVLWLRSFGVDISCVEMTPYKLDGPPGIILVPRVIIPIPEAREYLVSVEKKEAKKLSRAKANTEVTVFWAAIGDEFNALNNGFRTSGTSRGQYMKVHVGHSSIHYEWAVRKRANCVDICLHFESSDKAWNDAGMARLVAHERAIREGIDLEYEAGRFGRRWTEMRFRLPFEDSLLNTEVAPRAAQLMDTLISRTIDDVRKIIEESR